MRSASCECVCLVFLEAKSSKLLFAVKHRELTVQVLLNKQTLTNVSSH